MKDLFQKGKLTSNEYQTYLNRYNYANYCKSACDRLCERSDYLIGFNKSHDNIEFIYEEGVTRLLGAPIDITAVLTAVFICGYIFSIEYDTGFHRILRLTRKGHGITFRNKIVLALIISTFIYIAFSAVDIVNLLKNYNVDYLSANVMSIPRYAELNTDMSILSYLIIYKIISFIGYEVCFLLVTALSCILENQIKTVIVSISVILIPFIIDYYGIPLFQFISISYFMSPENIFKGFATCGVCTVLTLFTAGVTYRKWNGRVIIPKFES